ncbi:unnamed protein product [Prorocentrum cordatum]|uniref:C2 domain-containing protein n=1 Tax=Prorocentrum cordatum TaxID=2364126 RepID=A0ABN9QJZ6_9DINO|nr:unnamed protein product [Polarella glacialis]
MVALIADAERDVWAGPLGVVSPPVHAMTFDRTRLLWAQYFRQFEKQDAAVRGFLASLKSLATSGSSSPSQGAAQGTPGQQPAVAATILGFLRELHQRCLEQQGPAAHAGMLRRTPEKLCEELGPREGPGLVGQAWSLAARAAEEYFRTAQGQQEHLRRCTSTPDWVRTPPRCRGEPQALTRAVWEECMRQAVQKHKGAFDGGVVLALFEAFHHPRDLEISLNEVCAAVVCASSATVAEKAEALFGLYGTAQSVNDMFHVVPMSVSSAAVIEGLEGNRRLAAVDTDARQQFPAPANDDDIAGMALHFRLYGSNRRGRDTDSLLGHVFVPSLHDFSWSGVGIDRPRTFPIWGERVPIPVGTTQFISSGRSGSSARPLVGEAKMAIKWMPSDPDGSCVGQIGIHLFSVSFTARELSAQEKNPSLRVVTHDEAGGEVKIERWDPRKGLTRVAGTLKDMALTNVYGGHIEFSPTMWWDTLGALHTYHDGRGDQGWREAERSWVWSRKMGDQYSVQGMRLPEKFVLPEEHRASKEGRSCASSDPNVISLQACRLLTQTILLRGYHCVTNRQAALISDMTFSRAGAVPGLLDAVLVPGEIGGHSDFEQARQDGRCTDVKYSMIYTHELQVTVAAGSLSLFPPRDGGSLTLQHLNIQDPYPGSAKVLWIRFARAGDGRRATVQIPVSPVGYLTLPPPDEIDVDMPERAVVQASGGGKPLDTAATQMSVTKSEFVNCVLASPLLSETLRRMTMVDDSPDSDAPSATPTRAGVAVNLHVTIDDPDQDQEQQEFMDALELRQGILLEVWDSDGLSSRSDLLGECWLPQLSRFGPEPQVLDLMLEKPPDVTDATSTRPDPHKQLDESIVVKGSLKVEVTWKFPLAEPEQPDGAGANLSREELAKRRALMHSGTCTLKILEARRLRSADVGTFNRPGKSDPYVCVYVRNEAFGADEQDLKRGFGKGGWHVSDTRPHQWKPLMQTKVVKDNNNPVWKDEEKTFDLQTGGFERRTKRTRTLTHPVTKRGRQLKQDQEHLSAVGKSSENDLDVYFESSISQRDEADEDDDEDRGRRHGFRVFRGDTIFSFKDKLREACMAESDHEERHSFRTRYESAAKSISAQHVVMVFVPPDNLRSLKQRRQELNYKRQLQLELQDPSNWQPLDDLKTFGQYATSFGFGPEGEHQRLMVREGSEDLKNKNLRYRQFAEQRRRLVEPVGTTDTEAECFGYALCFHERDGGSREWRQALIRRPEQPGAPPRASLLCPLEGGASAAAPPQGAAGAELVLPAPAEPRIFDFSVPGHAEFLALAPALQAQGKSEREILEELNKAQREKWMRAKSQAGPGAGRARPRATGQEPGREPGQAPGPEPDGPQRKQPPRPVDITAREVRAALRRGGLG